MRIVETLPRRVREIENIWIPAGSTGHRMAARLWLPEGAEQEPVPAILTYLPYRKRDSTRGVDDPMHRYFSGHGYACLRVDMRGETKGQGRCLLWTTRTHWLLSADLDAWEGDVPVFSRHVDIPIARDLV